MTDTAAAPPLRVHAFEHAPFVYRALAVYTALAVVLMAARGVGLSTTHLLLIAIIATAATVRLRPAVWDWLPLGFLIVMFQDLASETHAVAGIVNPQLSITVERALFGGPVASGWLQSHLSGLPGMHAAASGFAVEYLVSDLAPTGIAAWLWLRHRDAFRVFLAADVLVHVIGFSIYTLFPESPPWMAARQGLVPPIQRLVVDALASLPGGLSTWYSSADPAPNAAMPSIHVAIPVLVATILIHRHGWLSRLSLPAVVWAVTIAAGVVYSGEHYLADVVAGAGLGAICVVVGERVTRPSWAATRHAPEALEPASDRP